MKKYSIIFNVFKSSYFYQCAVNVSPSKCKEKGSIFTIPIFTIWNSYGPSEREVILVRIHTSLRLFTALGFFRKMAPSPQIMGLDKQKSLCSCFTSKLVSFKLKDHARLESCQFQG